VKILRDVGLDWTQVLIKDSFAAIFRKAHRPQVPTKDASIAVMFASVA
jgi:hypothetical protein